MRRSHLLRVTLAVAVFASFACSNKLAGTVELNGEKLSFSSCRNGVIYGFRGVELSTSDGVKLRVGVQPTGAAGVIVMPKGASVGVELGVACGSLAISDQNSTINDVKNVEGKAVFDHCEGQGYKVTGEVTFENCH